MWRSSVGRIFFRWNSSTLFQIGNRNAQRLRRSRQQECIRFVSSHQSATRKENIEALVKRVHEINQSSRHQDSSRLKAIVSAIEGAEEELKELEALATDSLELKEIATADVAKLRIALKGLEDELVDLLVEMHSDPMDESSGIILEVCAGVGGQEAMLFSDELFQMYSSFATFNGWAFDILSYAGTELGGCRQASARLTGSRVYKFLKFEAGVHRVQRIPKTERAGRVHTSTSTVAILPTPSEIQVEIRPEDLRIETKRSSGAGGMNVNKTETAVRITHLPTRIIIDSQTQRSQSQNKSLGMAMLRAKLYERQLESQKQVISSTRKLQVGLGNRNEKIRTYNFSQDRVTDHRVGLTVHNIRGFLEGQEYLDSFLRTLNNYDNRERLNAIISESKAEN